VGLEIKSMNPRLPLAAALIALFTWGCGPPGGDKKDENDTVSEISRGLMTRQVVESGTLDAFKTVEVKSRVGGRVAQLLVDEGDTVEAGQLIAIIDPQETELQVEQTAAQLRGARSAVDRSNVEIAQRRITVQTNLARARSRVDQLELEVKAQPELTQAAIASARAGLESSERDLTLLQTVSHPNARLQAEREVADTQASLERAQAELRRRRALVDQGYLAGRELETAELDVKLADTRLINARQRLQKLPQEHKLEIERQQKRIEQARTELARAEANKIADPNRRRDLDQARQTVRDAEAALRDIDALIASRGQQEASVDQISTQLRDGQRLLGETEIRAPVAGVVTRRFVQVGELVNALSSFSPGTAIIRIEDRSSMKVNLEINEIDIALLELGTSAQVRIDAFPGESIDGEVTKISPASTFTLQQDVNAVGSSDQVVKYSLEVTLANADPKLRSGMSAQVTIVTLRKENVLRVRTEFIGGKPGERRFVAKVTGEPKKEGEAPPTEEQTVEVGITAGAFTEILSGVEAGTKVARPKTSFPERRGLGPGSGGGGDGDENGEEGGGG
jgi:HlyD family secretion protein